SAKVEDEPGSGRRLLVGATQILHCILQTRGHGNIQTPAFAGSIAGADYRGGEDRYDAFTQSPAPFRKCRSLQAPPASGAAWRVAERPGMPSPRGDRRFVFA